PAFVVKMHCGVGSGEKHHRLQPGAKGAESLPKAHRLPAGTQQVVSRSDGGPGAPPAGRAESALLLQALQGLWLRLAALPGTRWAHPDPDPSRSQGAEADAGEGQSPNRSHASSGPWSAAGGDTQVGANPARAAARAAPTAPSGRGRPKERGATTA